MAAPCASRGTSKLLLRRRHSVCYFLLCFTDDRIPRLRPSIAKGLTVFLAATGAEFLQGLGVPLLGRTLDPWDVVMYAVGTGMAALLDSLVLSRFVRAWPLAVPGASE